MKMKADTYSLVAIMAAMLVAMYSLFQIKQTHATLVPLIISIAVFILATVALVKSVLPENKAGTALPRVDTEEREEAGGSLRRHVVAGLWILGFFLSIYVLGLRIAIGLFVFSYMKLHGTSWWMSILLTVLTLVFAYGVFEIGLSVRLYKGLLFAYLGY
jgi:hypothetical protein